MLKELHEERMERNKDGVKVETGMLGISLVERPGLALGSSTWSSAFALARYLSGDARALIERRSLIELGAGTGLVGIACAKLGAKSVILTDLPVCLDLLRTNIEANEVENSASVQVLDWTNNGDFSAVADIIIMADVVYYDQIPLFEAIVSTLRRIVTTSSHVIMAYKQRDAENESLFFDMMKGEGFGVVRQMALDDNHSLFIWTLIETSSPPRELMPHEVKLFVSGMLKEYTHENASSRWFRALHHFPSPGDEKVVLYRHMGDKELFTLLETGCLPDTQPYQTIVCGEEGYNYCMKYFIGKKHVDSNVTTIVEFVADREMIDDFYRIQSKPEQGTMSHGLGSKAGRTLSRFNEALKTGEIQFQIVFVKREKRIKKKR